MPESEYLTQMKDNANVLEIDNLHTYFFTDVGTVHSVDGISFNVPVGKTVGVVGESGCGKSVTSLSIMQLLQRPQPHRRHRQTARSILPISEAKARGRGRRH